MQCYFCKKQLSFSDKVSFREDCPHCGGSVHICYNCNFYDASAYNECKETSADRVVDKEKANYCEYFITKSDSSSDNSSDPAEEAKRKLKELFGS